MSKTPVFIASDHRGFSLKTKLIAWLSAKNFLAEDLGPVSEDRCDATDYAIKLANKMKGRQESKGVLICGSGQAMAMTANRYQHLRAALCTNVAMTQLAREHNDANVLVLGADMLDLGTAEQCLQVFLNTNFLGGRYADRCDKLNNLGGL